MIKSVKQLAEIRAVEEAKITIRNGRDLISSDGYNRHVLVCAGTGCTSSGSLKIAAKLEEEITKNGLDKEAKIVRTGCFGLCALAPIMIVYPEGTFYAGFSIDDVEEIVVSHLKNNTPATKFIYTEKAEDGTDVAVNYHDTTFYKRQTRVALSKCGTIDPENIFEYVAKKGYAALGKVLTEMQPEEVIQCMLDSGLRGRGGGGFPTGLKWKFAAGNRGNIQKYVICNADEGDPGAFMDSSVCEGDPHAVLEAMAIAGFAIGADQGYIYCRAENPNAVKKLRIAIGQAREQGMLGKDIFGTGFDFDIDIRLGAGAFVCGEETALITSIEGNRGEPRPRPPFPAVKGLFGMPTIINNVETYANIPQIILNGPEWFAAMGTEKAKGTKVFALSGKINNTGLVEIPMGTTIREVIEEIGGGIPKGKKFKAVQMGGPSGGCVPAELIDTPIEYDTLIALGAMIGSGGLIVLDEDNCMVDIAKFFLEFTVDESCGKCTPCRVGTRKMLDILTRITEGKGEDGDIEKLEELGNMIKTNSLCGLGQTAPNPVLSTIRYFRHEYEAHIYKKECPAHACKSLASIVIEPELCRGCSACVRACPVGAISGVIKSPYTIDQDKCIKCEACIAKCKFGAIVKK